MSLIGMGIHFDGELGEWAYGIIRGAGGSDRVRYAPKLIDDGGWRVFLL